ncbi:glutathione S-transferase family protein [Aquibium sp. ELW1220]|jgi:glutathione S-transferase|uniref:glutathione S-transferase family protein n=1 Tax=Aquibium sp. ELW1220 TaxID=2976766 RepID=UPI0025B15575|nr:glutathione S-transferase family protein [Aquibium sp. ELW1220]MDN2584100.1 glutathione S-transferase family protein [Aquibium sp. ELW1220]
MTDKFNLYYDRAACSLGVRIALEAAGADYTDTRVAIRKGEAQSPDYLKVNPAGRVPALGVPGEDEALGELTAIYSFLAEFFPQAGLVPPSGMARARALSWMSMLATHVHAAGFGPFFRPQRFAPGEAVQKEVQAQSVATIADGYRQIEARLPAGGFAMGDGPTAVDYMIYVYGRWAEATPIKVAEQFPKLAALVARVEALPQTKAALEKENLPPVAG